MAEDGFTPPPSMARSKIEDLKATLKNRGHKKLHWGMVAPALATTRIGSLIQSFIDSGRLSEGRQHSIMRKAEVIQCPRGQLLFQSFEQNEEIYVILSGRVSFYIQKQSSYIVTGRKPKKKEESEQSELNFFGGNSALSDTVTVSSDWMSEHPGHGSGFGSKLGASMLIRPSLAFAHPKHLLKIPNVQFLGAPMIIHSRINALKHLSGFGIPNPKESPAIRQQKTGGVNSTAAGGLSSLQSATQDIFREQRTDDLLTKFYVQVRLKIGLGRILRRIRLRKKENLSLQFTSAEGKVIVKNANEVPEMEVRTFEADSVVINPRVFGKSVSDYVAVVTQDSHILVLRSHRLLEVLARHLEAERHEMAEFLTSHLPVNFDMIPKVLMSRVLTESKMILAEKGRVLVTEGSTPKDFFVVMEGEVLLSRSVSTLSQTNLIELGLTPGDIQILTTQFKREKIPMLSAFRGTYFGEDRIFDPTGAATLSAQAVSNQVRLLKIPLALLKAFPGKTLSEMWEIWQEKLSLREETLKNALQQRLIALPSDQEPRKLRVFPLRSFRTRKTSLPTKENSTKNSFFSGEKEKMAATLEKIALLTAPRVNLNGNLIRQSYLCYTHRQQAKSVNGHHKHQSSEKSELTGSDRKPLCFLKGRPPSRRDRFLDIFRTRTEALTENSNFFIIKHKK